MAIQLIREVVAYLPGSALTPAERTTLFAIAEAADANTREAYQCTGENGRRRWVLAEIVGVGDDGLKSILQRLAKRDLEVRVPIGKDKKERVIYAVKGHQTTYRLPALGGVLSPPMNSYGGVTSPNGGVVTPDGGVRTSPFSSASPSYSKSSSAEAFISEATGATAEEAEAIVKRIDNERQGAYRVRTWIPFLRKFAEGGDLKRYLVEHRAATKRANDDADRKHRQGQPPCEHGMAGGNQQHPRTGELWCTDCRKAQRLTDWRTA
ncbi:hypothetical protein [Actinoplanes subtropicus]|uniref:hypothetical protein n=1 Tax=Actinoplanes subtropicus TaxID=543632 RepID=UPI0004C3DB2D|nr:hypothetical protein [Actinoplanes subtropicus]